MKKFSSELYCSVLLLQFKIMVWLQVTLFTKALEKIDFSDTQEARDNEIFFSDCGVSTSSSDVNMQCASFAL